MKISKRFTGMIVLICSSILLSSCMHSMMGGHDKHNGHSPEKVTKEIIKGEYTLSVIIEPMTVGKESAISLNLTSSFGAIDSVSVHYMISKKSKAEQNSGHHHENNSEETSEFLTIHNNIVLKKGSARIPFTPAVAGAFVFSVEVENLPNTEVPFSTEVSFSVHEEQSSGMMGMSSTYWYLGAIAMAGMMVIMWSGVAF